MGGEGMCEGGWCVGGMDTSCAERHERYEWVEGKRVIIYVMTL